MADNKDETGSKSASTPMTDTQLGQVSGGAFSPNKCRMVCLECGWESTWDTAAVADAQWADHEAATGHSVSMRLART